jgi:hypothetical protein
MWFFKVIPAWSQAIAIRSDINIKRNLMNLRSYQKKPSQQLLNDLNNFLH